jgi:hypothetical protein
VYNLFLDTISIRIRTSKTTFQNKILILANDIYFLILFLSYTHINNDIHRKLGLNLGYGGAATKSTIKFIADP